MIAPFAVPPLPGEPLHSIATVARRAGCSRQAIYNAIDDGKIGAVTVAGRLVITEGEAERFLREWPSRPNGQAVAARWAEYRAWKAMRRATVQPMEAA
jgi:hypothetical protein